MTEYKPTTTFQNNIFKLSRTKNFVDLKNEWKYVRLFKSDKKDKRCLCHSSIKNQYYFVNKFTSKIIAIGGTCIDTFKNIEDRRYRPPRIHLTNRYINDLNSILGGDRELGIEIDLNEYCAENYHTVIDIFKIKINRITYIQALEDYKIYLNLEWKYLFNINPLLECIEEKKIEILEANKELIKQKEINIKLKQNELYKLRYELVVEEIKETKKIWDDYWKRKRMRKNRRRLKRFIYYHMEVYNSNAYLDYNSE